MNRLALAIRLRQECGASGTGPVTTIGQVGEMQRLVTWIDNAWLELQDKRPNWNWMIEPFDFLTVPSQYEYTPTDAGIGATFANWKRDTLRTYRADAGVGTEQYLSFWDYNDFRDYYLFSTRRTSLAQPLQFAVSPKKNLLLGSPPDQVYHVVGEYYTLPTEMAADTDEPTGLPARFHMAIVYRAMIDYGMYEAAPEVVQRGQAGWEMMLKKIEDDQLFDIAIAGPLA
jgi:hypothetical protein